jgi:hypothetical protein
MAASALAAPEGARWRVLDLGPHCVLRESLAGFGSAGVPACVEPDGRQEHWIAAGVGALSDTVARRLSAFVSDGGRLVFESAAGFGGFEEQRRMLARHFALRIGRPVDLWAQGAAPYIHYTWPARVKVRDFSRVVPFSGDGCEVIGFAGSLPVAARRGRFVFLGSPIGPGLLAGEREARAWLSALFPGI